MKRRSFIKGILASLPAAGVPLTPFGDSVARVSEMSMPELARIDNEYSLLLPGEREMLDQPLQVTRIALEGDFVGLRMGSESKTLHIGETAQGWKLLTILPQFNGARVAVLERHATHQGTIAFITEQGQLARMPKQIGDLSRIKPRLAGLPAGPKFRRPKNNQPSPDQLGDYILYSDEDPCYENVAALGQEYTGWTLVSDDGVGPIESLWLEADGTSRELGDSPRASWAPDAIGRRFQPSRLLPNAYLYAYKPGFSKRTLLGGFLPAADIGVWNPDNKVGYEVMMVMSSGPERKPMGRIRATRPRSERPASISADNTADSETIDGVTDTYWNCTPQQFWNSALGLWQRWTKFFDQQMRVDIPDPWLLQAAKAGIVLARCSYRGLEPTYQVGEGFYTKIPERSHALFPVAQYEFVWAQQLWNQTLQVEQQFQHYLNHYILPDGNFLYNTQDQVEAPMNTGVFLQNSARAYDYTGDLAALQKRIPVLRTMIQFVMARNSYTKRIFPESDPRHGLIWGSPEADNGDPAADTPNAHLYYYQNSAWIWRGLKEHARCLQRAGSEHSDKSLSDEGAKLSENAAQFRAEVERSLQYTMNHRNGDMKTAGITPFSAFDTTRKPTDLTGYENHRYMSDWWTADWGDPQLDLGHQRHRVIAGRQILGMNVCSTSDYGGGSGTLMTANFMEHGTLAQRIRLADYRPFLMTLYGNLCFAMDCGSRYAPEDALLPGSYPGEGSPTFYSAVINSGLQPAMALRWLLCYEESDQDIIHLQKAAPKHWFAAGQRIVVENCPTRFGAISWTCEDNSDKGEKGWTVNLAFKPSQTSTAQIVIHLHPSDGRSLRTTTNGKIVGNSIVISAGDLTDENRLSFQVT